MYLDWQHWLYSVENSRNNKLYLEWATEKTKTKRVTYGDIDAHARPIYGNLNSDSEVYVGGG